MNLKYSVSRIKLPLTRWSQSGQSQTETFVVTIFQFLLCTIKKVQELYKVNDLYPHTDDTNTQQMMSYKIRASGASHRFGNLSTLSARQVDLIELRKCLSTAALHHISIAACMKPRSQNYFENIIDTFSTLYSRRLPRAQFVKRWFNQFLSRWIQKLRSHCTYSVINIDLSQFYIPFVTDCIELFPNNKSFLFHFLFFSLLLYCSICQRWKHWFYYRNTACISAWGENIFSTVWQIVKRTTICLSIYLSIYIYI